MSTLKITVLISAAYMAYTTTALAGYGAFAYDPTNERQGWTNNFSSQEAADSRALDICGTQNCVVRSRYSGANCFGISHGIQGGWGSVVKSSREEAISAAFIQCQQLLGIGACRPARAACTTP